MNDDIITYKSTVSRLNPHNRDLTNEPEYKLISSYYGNRTAKRSGVPLINHIIEGDYILWTIGASLAARRAFFLHPLIQNDEDMKANLSIFKNPEINSYVLYLALEYRNIANQYLSDRKIAFVEDIALSPLEEVNHMLLADKIQNYKDFILYHRGTHPRSDELTQYFENWLFRIGVFDYDKWFSRMKEIFPPQDKSKLEINY